MSRIDFATQRSPPCHLLCLGASSESLDDPESQERSLTMLTNKSVTKIGHWQSRGRETHCQSINNLGSEPSCERALCDFYTCDQQHCTRGLKHTAHVESAHYKQWDENLICLPETRRFSRIPSDSLSMISSLNEYKAPR